VNSAGSWLYRNWRQSSANAVASISGPIKLPGRRDQATVPASRNAQPATTVAADLARVVVARSIICTR
jgi:surfactin synthase thioesterase subunit